MKLSVITVVSLLIALMAGMPIVYADCCEFDIAVMQCRHQHPSKSFHKTTACRFITLAETIKCNCPQHVPCEFTKKKPSALLTMRAVFPDLTRHKIQWVMAFEQDGPGLNSHMEILDPFYFSKRGSSSEKFYVIYQSFLC